MWNCIERWNRGSKNVFIYYIMRDVIVVSIVGGIIIIVTLGLVVIMAAGGGFNKPTNDAIGSIFNAIFDSPNL